MNNLKLPKSGLHLVLDLAGRALLDEKDFRSCNYDLPLATAPSTITRQLSGWGCSAFAAFHALLALNIDVSLKEVTQKAVLYGANPKVGGDNNTMEKVMKSYGCTTKYLKLKDSRDLDLYLDRNSVAITTLVKYYENEGFGEHWVTVPQVKGSDLLVLDSDYRDRRHTFGSYLLTPAGFKKSCLSVAFGWWFDGSTKVLFPYVYPGYFMIARRILIDS